MFYLNREKELTVELLYKMMQKFNTSIKPKLQSYKDYYDGKQNICLKQYSDESKPCSKSVTNYAKNIADSYCGYIASPSYISYQSDNDIDEIMQVLRYNDYQEEDSSFLADALIYGVAAELMYVDTDSQVRFKLINPLQCFAVYDDSLTNDMLYFVRWYRANEWEDNELYNVDVYSDVGVKHYTMIGTNGGFNFISEEPHYFSQCPANVFYLPDEKSIFDCVIGLQDLYNEVLNSEVDDFSAFVDAYLTLNGVDADTEDIANMKENRVLVLPQGASAEWLTKNSSDTQVENLLKRVHDSIYRIAQCPDFSSETFVGGVSSGIALRFRLCGMENRASKIEGLMKKALQRRVEIICGIASLKLGEEVFRDITINFTRNIPSDNTDVINLVNALRGFVSDETLLSMIPQVEDVAAELERVKAQKQENMNLYGFGSKTEDKEVDIDG